MQFKFSVSYNAEEDRKWYYTDWLSNPYTPTPLRNYFKYKYLGKVPEDRKQEELFKKMEEYQSKFNKQ